MKNWIWVLLVHLQVLESVIVVLVGIGFCTGCQMVKAILRKVNISPNQFGTAGSSFSEAGR